MLPQNEQAIDTLVPDGQVQKEFGGKNRQTIYRWDQDQKMIDLGWPPKVLVSGRGHRSRFALEAFKRRLIEDAVQARNAVRKIA
jgi:hypothetical protein